MNGVHSTAFSASISSGQRRLPIQTLQARHGYLERHLTRRALQARDDELQITVRMS